jgi:CDP-diacylglycerol--glycerol-3-phosphate 3-phosphatidyltransferase
MKGPGFWNLPNILTLMRMALVPVMLWLLLEAPTPAEGVVCCVIFVGAMITDIIDGYLARKWGLVSAIGAFLDPLADKLMVVTTLVMLVPLGWLPAWLVAVLICRELTITALRTIAVSEGMVLAADHLGKFKTAFQSTALGFLLWHYPTSMWPPQLSTASGPPTDGYILDAHSCGVVLLYIALFFSLVSAFNYLRSFFNYSAQREAGSA